MTEMAELKYLLLITSGTDLVKGIFFLLIAARNMRCDAHTTDGRPIQLIAERSLNFLFLP